MAKPTPHFTWFTWDVGAHKFQPESRAHCARLLRAYREDKRFSVETVDKGLYRVKRDDIMALIRTRT